METGQFYIDREGHTVLLGEYVILFPVGVVLQLQQSIEKILGEEKAKEVITALGEFQVEAAARRYIKRFNFQKLDKRKIMDLTTRIINILGWGNVLVNKMSLKDKTAHIILKESTLSLKYKHVYQKESNKPIDYWVAGILKKHFSLIFGTEVEIKETKCLACGDPYCEFIVKPKS